MDNNESEQRTALGIMWAIVGVVVIAMLFLAGYFGMTAGKDAKQHAAVRLVMQESAAPLPPGYSSRISGAASSQDFL